MTSNRVVVYLDNVIFHRLQRRLSGRNYGCRLRPKYRIVSQFSILLLPKMLCLRTPLWGGAYDAPDPSWETLGHTLAEGSTEWRGPGPRDPTIRHCLLHWCRATVRLMELPANIICRLRARMAPAIFSSPACVPKKL